MRPGLHLSNVSPITPADEDIVRRWAPLSALLAMNNIVEDNDEIVKLVSMWEAAGRPLLVLRKYFGPEGGLHPNRWGIHTTEAVIMARRCMQRGIPAGKIALKPFNEPNMPTWACNEPYGEGFGDKEEHIERYGQALATFIDVAKNEEPDVLIGGPHLTVGNHDVRFPNDPAGRYYYGPNSLCQHALDNLDLHFVHCYGFRRGQYKDRAHGLRFLEYEKYFSGKPIYIVEGTYGVQWENGNSIDPSQNNVRGEDTVAYLRLLDQHPQVEGITLWIGGWTGWQDHRHSDDAGAGSHRPVVRYVEDYVKGLSPGPQPEPPPKPEPGPIEPLPKVKMRAYLKDGSETDAGKLLEAYRVVIAPCQGPGFYVVEIRERCEPANCDVRVKGAGAEPLVGKSVRWGWSREEVGQETDPYGRVGFAMAASAKYDPALGGGPHWTAVAGNSETVRGIGMIMGTVHCTLNFVFRYLEGTPAPQPEPEPPMPEPPAEPYTLKGALNKRLEAAGLPPIQDVRSTILEKYVDLTRVGKRGLGPESLWSITFHHLPTLETCLEADVLEVARYHTQTKGWPDISYDLIVGFEDEEGKVPTFFTGLLVHYSEQSGYGRVNRYSIAVAVAGNFSIDEKTRQPKQRPTKGQLKALRCIVESLEEFVGGGRGQCRPLPILRHYDVVNTECPGVLYEDYVAWRDL